MSNVGRNEKDGSFELKPKVSDRCAMPVAIVTASYHGDFDRCRLLCESIDRRVSGYTNHYILVEKADLALFATLAGPKRIVVDERQLLPRWLRVFPDPSTLGRRRVWLSLKGPPLRGWHVQQLRKLAFAQMAQEEGTLFCDSDTVFIHETDLADQWHDGRLPFYCKPDEIDAGMKEHERWSRRAGELLGIDPGRRSKTDYIAQSVTWRNDTVRDMLERIEAVNGKSWVAAVASRRAFSECLIYGRYVDEIEERPDRHAPTNMSICHSYWKGPAMNEANLLAFIRKAGPDQPIVGLQSFVGTDVSMISRAIGLA